jgi:hypothetical protein
MKHLKLFEGFNKMTIREVEELLEDLFVEIFDKWSIEKSSGYFNYDVCSVESNKPYIYLIISKTVFSHIEIDIFRELVEDCQPVLHRLSLYGIKFKWDEWKGHEPLNDAVICKFRVFIYLDDNPDLIVL